MNLQSMDLSQNPKSQKHGKMIQERYQKELKFITQTNQELKSINSKYEERLDFLQTTLQKEKEASYKAEIRQKEFEVELKLVNSATENKLSTLKTNFNSLEERYKEALMEAFEVKVTFLGSRFPQKCRQNVIFSPKIFNF